MPTNLQHHSMTLPSFLIVGAQKSGTTSLASYLSDHPDVLMPEHPVTFFNRNFERGLDWYSQHFPTTTEAQKVGEGTPEYMYHESVAPRIAESLPGVRLIAILRNPVDRAYSHYWHNQTRGREQLSFQGAVAAEPARLSGADPTTRARYAYLDRGRYLKQLKHLRRYVPADHLHVLIFEELRKDPIPVVQQTFAFLGIDSTYVPNNIGHVRNRFVSFRSQKLRKPIRHLPAVARMAARRLNARHSSYPPLENDFRLELAEGFAQDNRDLEDWLGRDLSLWGK